MYKEAETRTASEGTTIGGIFVTFLGDWLESKGWRPEIKTEYIISDDPKPKARRRLSCFGIARPAPGLNLPHDMESIRTSIAKGLAKEYAELEKRRGFV